MPPRGLMRDHEGYVIVYTDGCCLNNGYPNAQAGIGVWFNDNHPLNVSRPLEGKPTSQRAELHAVIAACEEALDAGIEKLRIFTDSHYALKCHMEWIDIWQNNGWRNVNGYPVANKRDIIEMINLLDQLIIKWTKIEAHSGVHGNEMADELAREGAEDY